jgi:hypothetical protein
MVRGRMTDGGDEDAGESQGALSGIADIPL